MIKTQLKIRGVDESLDGVIEGIIVLDELIEQNRYDFRQTWKSFLPEEDFSSEKGKMAYVPIVAMRKCYPEHGEFSGKVRDIPYFIFVLNQARESRPKSLDKKIKNGGGKGRLKSHCKLCENIIDQGMIIGEIDNYWLTPNGYPYHMYASLLINKSLNRKQGDISAGDIATWMRTSVLLDQYVFYNTVKAGASIGEHQHAQVVDHGEIKVNNEVVPYPILNNTFVDREQINGTEDVFRLKNYPVDALIFTGRDAPHKAEYAAHLLVSEGQAFNILVNKNEVFVIGRNKEKEKSVCIRRNVGGYELSGVGLLGDIEEKSGDLMIKVEGAKIFSNMTYEIFGKNLRASSTGLDGIARKFTGVR